MNEAEMTQQPTNPALNIASVSRCPSINFFNVDCIEFMKSKPDKCYDLAIVDPPYGLGIDGQKEVKKGKKSDRKGHSKKDWDNAIPTPEYFEQLFRVSKNQIIWGGNYFVKHLTEGHKGWIIWDKAQHGLTMSDCELAYSSFDYPTRIYTKNRAILLSEGETRHPTQKPIQLYRWLLNRYATKGMKILDTHGGSFNHAIAAEIEGFDLDIMDIDSEYFQAGVNAFNLHKRQQRLF